jgi:hypothetical protein
MSLLSEDYRNRIANIITINDKIFFLGLKEYRKFPSGECEKPTHFVFQNYLERFIFNLEATNVLLKEYLTKPSMEHSIGMLIRSSLLDFLTIQYLTSYGFDKVDENSFIKIGNSILCDHIHNTFKYYKITEVDTGIEFKEEVDNLRALFPFLFNDEPINYSEPAKNLIGGRLSTTTDMYNRIKVHPKTKKFAKVYELYSYYSKYEHFGILSHHFQKRGEDTNFNNMVWGLHYMILGIEISLAYLSDKVDTNLAMQEIQLLRTQFEVQIPEAIKE